MIRDTYTAIVNGIEVRQNLSKLRQELKEDANVSAFLYFLGGDFQLLIQLLSDEDAKIRKNCSLLLGRLAQPSLLEPLFQAYESETQMFVKSSYLTALKEYDYRPYLPKLKERLKELSSGAMKEEEKKHVQEELRVLTELVTMIEGVKHHPFTGYNVPSRVVCLMNRNHIRLLKNQLKSLRTKEFGAGLIVDTNDLEELLDIRFFSELLFMVEGLSNVAGDAGEIAEQVTNSKLMEFLEKRHKGKAPFYFRIELKSKMELDKKSVFLKKLSAEIEHFSNRRLINSKSQYEFELRLIEKKEGGFYVLTKLYTLPDERFSYRLESLAASIRPVNAALMMELTKAYQKEDAKILDPFCGVGTMLMERHKCKKANTMYGLDLYGEAIEKAKTNTEAAGLIIHYINRDFFDFRHEYLFDEIVTNMPHAMGHRKEDEIQEIYRRFFQKAKEHLTPEGTILMYSHDREYVRYMSRTFGYLIQEEYEISMREGTYVYVLKMKS